MQALMLEDPVGREILPHVDMGFVAVEDDQGVACRDREPGEALAALAYLLGGDVVLDDLQLGPAGHRLVLVDRRAAGEGGAKYQDTNNLFHKPLHAALAAEGGGEA